MLVIDNVLISDDILKETFVCNIAACKGECCIAGDNGAPLEACEAEILSEDILKILPYLSDEGKQAIFEQNTSVYSKGKLSTPLINDGPCAYAIFDDNIARCGIEKAYYDGATSLIKPISCHLYPVRYSRSEFYEVLNYDKWEICKSACAFGQELKMPVYKFLKEPLTRKFGKDFYMHLEEEAEKL